MKKIAVALVLLLSASLLAEEPVNEAVIAQIKGEAFQHSAVMDTLSWLSDVYGPRLTGSPALRNAAEWARDQLTKWGMANAALEPNGPTSPRLVDRTLFDRDDRAAVHADHRLPARVVPGRRSPLTGTPISSRSSRRRISRRFTAR